MIIRYSYLIKLIYFLQEVYEKKESLMAFEKNLH